MANNDSSSSMQSDQYFAEMLGMMREQGRKDNPTTLQLGVMQSANSVKIDDLVLNAEDLYIADYLVAGYTRKIKVPYVSGVTVDTTQESGFVSANSSGKYSDPDTRTSTQSQITFTDGLKKGDLVAVHKLQNTNKFVILAKVVEA
ncbi:MAG: DUF2577 domain-containing protein [Lachnospiraceae bacterium]|nr:DUF2577 domain-containing protein [Lachnospiraceae bacterium]